VWSTSDGGRLKEEVGGRGGGDVWDLDRCTTLNIAGKEGDFTKKLRRKKLGKYRHAPSHEYLGPRGEKKKRSRKGKHENQGSLIVV